jgi:hypothetical protein
LRGHKGGVKEEWPDLCGPCVYSLSKFWTANVINDLNKSLEFVGLALVGKDIVFRLIIEYSSLRDFSPLVIIGLFLYEGFWKMIFWLVLKLEISYRVIIS